LSWEYDRFGNRKKQNVTAGSGVPYSELTINQSNNRIVDTGYAYDLSGNLINDGLNAMTYDAEHRAVTSAQAGITWTYLYDARGMRVKKCKPNCASPTAATVYLFSGTQIIAEYNALASPPSLLREYVYFGGQLMAVEEGGARRYLLRDHLSVRVVTDAAGAKIGEQGHYPYGEDWFLSGTTSAELFTSYEHEPESGNDYAIHRFHSCRLGRFTTPDPVHGTSTDPQRLNRYAYVTGDPINSLDLDGLEPNPDRGGRSGGLDKGDGSRFTGFFGGINIHQEFPPFGIAWSGWTPGTRFFGGAGGPACSTPVASSPTVAILPGGTSGFPTVGNAGCALPQASGPRCFARLRFRSGIAELIGKMHAFWDVKADGQEYIISGDGFHPPGWLNVFVTAGTRSSINADSSRDNLAFDSQESEVHCPGVRRMVEGGSNFPRNTVRYFPNGPNSNTIARCMGRLGGFSPSVDASLFPGWLATLPAGLCTR
jgi:RHS repeat-associated protein